MFKNIFNWFLDSQMSQIEKYISSQQPTSPADIDRLINEFNYKRNLNLL